MSGIAIVISGADFSQNNLGKVTFLEDSDITGLVILGKDNVIGKTAVYTISYIPVNTSQRGVTWSIASGADYASIDAYTGILTIKEGANNSSVFIQAKSLYNESVTALKSISVTYHESVIDFSNKVAYVPFPLVTSNFTIYMDFLNFDDVNFEGTKNRANLIADAPTNVMKNGVGAFALGEWIPDPTVDPQLPRNNIWGSVFPSGAKSGATSTNDYTMFGTLVEEGRKSNYILNSNAFYRNNALMVVGGNVSSLSYYNMIDAVSKAYIYFNYGGISNGYDIGGKTKSELTSLLNAGTIKADFGTLQIKSFIAFHNTKYTTVEDIIANRASADVDLQVDESGNIFNAGTSGSIIISD